ncbi:Ferredoxin [Rhodovulum sp. PH10]|uniref:4Fe-4S binding protein n=1 Tax=Rhodovulum sp. PH10 TaxID=1187851 RepID=UPI00027C1FA6|nr:4Fe-4S binding protein [Rhodovulum sp. PH10]EJW13268.1 Ferredoxin [Rhodovulum sp. PH10]
MIARGLRTFRAQHTWTVDGLLARTGDWLVRNQRTVQRAQWGVVLVYFTLLIVPVLLPMPARAAHIWSDVTLFSQFVFWGIWWPFVLLSMILVGRLWCGLLCPEGAVAENVARYSRGFAVPRWVKWKGWPFAAFALTTIYGQMTSVYQYPGPALVVLGFSTVAAILTAIFWGRDKRVWCRYLCPVTGVFAVLAKLAPVHFRVDHDAWTAWSKPRGTKPPPVNCAPLVPIATMRGNAACHMCGRCSGFRGAVTLARRSPNHEIVHVAGDETSPTETLLILFGLLGIAVAAFHWANSDLYIAVKQTLAEWLVGHDVMWPLETAAPWWLLTDYPDRNDVMTLLDGAVLVGYIAAVALVLGGALGACVAVATRLVGRFNWRRFHHLVQSLVPLAGCAVFLGLSMTTVSLLKSDGIALDFVEPLRAILLGGACLWSLWLGWRIAGLYSQAPLRRIAAMLPLALAAGIAATSVATLFWPL